MPDIDAQWRNTVKGMLKAELKRRGVSYDDLATKLRALGIHETQRGIANKLSRGGFSGVFLVQCLVAIGCDTVRLDDFQIP